MQEINFKLLPKRSYTTECPLCSKYREKSGTKTLQVFRDPDGFIRWQCMHVDQCDLNERQYMKDPDPQFTDHTKVGERDIAIPILSEITDYIDGHRVWWYRDLDSKPLFGIIRIEKDGKKTYRPVREINGKLTYVNTKWPDNTVLFNNDKIRDHNTIIVVEGEKAAEAGSKLFKKAAVVTWRGGAANISSGAWDLLEGKEVIFWPDNDDVGKNVMQRIFEGSNLTKAKLAYVDHLPAKADLADDLSVADINKAINDATILQKHDEGLMSFEDLVLQHSEFSRKLETGVDAIDTHISLPISGIVVIEGRTGHGKSSLATHISNAVLKRGHKVAVFNYEERADMVLCRYIRNLNPELSIEESFESEEMGYYKDLQGESLYLYDQKFQIHTDALCKKLDSPRWTGSLVIVDNLQIVPVRGIDRRLAIKDMVDRLRVIANKWGFTILALSQLTPDKNPRYDAPREAKDIHNSADTILRVWNQKTDGDNPKYSKGTPGNYFVEIYKSRYGEMGKVLGFDFINGATFEFKGLGERVLMKNTETEELTKSDVKKLVKAIQDLADAMVSSQINRLGV